MSLDNAVLELFVDAFQKHWSQFNVAKEDFILSVQNMQSAYSIEGLRIGSSNVLLNYNKASDRCAYLHKYAPCHAALIHYVFKINHSYMELIEALVRNKTDPIRICCIGGGPGTDVVGMSALFSTMPCCKESSFQFTTIDMFEWSLAYESITEILRGYGSIKYGSLGEFLSRQEVRSSYIRDDVSLPRGETLETVKSSDLLTMIKVVSAATPTELSTIFQHLFTSMKSGALLLFVDNASGGFYEKTCQAASLYGLTAPLLHQVINYTNPLFKRDLHGASSLSCTKVAVQLWKKP